MECHSVYASNALKTCSRKVRFDSRSDAKKYNRHFSSKHPQDIQRQRPYRCKCCGGWHLTSWNQKWREE